MGHRYGTLYDTTKDTMKHLWEISNMFEIFLDSPSVVCHHPRRDQEMFQNIRQPAGE